MRPSEKKATKLGFRVRRDIFSGPVWRSKLRNCGDFQYFQGNAADFLCNPDCVGEREGFEVVIRIRVRRFPLKTNKLTSALTMPLT